MSYRREKTVEALLLVIQLEMLKHCYMSYRIENRNTVTCQTQKLIQTLLHVIQERKKLIEALLHVIQNRKNC